MPYKKTPSDLQIPEHITKNKDTVALSEFALKAYGRSIDLRLKWEKALQTATNMRRYAVKQREKEERNDVMDKRQWPWIEGYKFHCDGPNATTQNNAYIKNLATGLEFCCMEDNLPLYLEEGFNIPSAEPSSENVGVRPEKKYAPPKPPRKINKPVNVKAESPAKPRSTTKEPVIEEPKVKEPKVKEPKAKEPKIEEIPAPIVAKETNIPIDKGPAIASDS